MALKQFNGTCSMVSKISDGIEVSVETFYQPEYSNPMQREFMFAYKVTITNNNRFSIKLLSRHWFIYDSNGTRREVVGDGVVGVQPIINSQKHYEYVSGCNLNSELGKMYGTYTVENVLSRNQFQIAIPAFEMVAPQKLN